MISALLSRVISLTLGTLYPAYASYKAVRTKNVKEYVKWMMYWIVFAIFTSVETVSDVFLGFWFPFYYELKICLLIWLLSPATKGASLLYRKFVHPALVRREEDIDSFLLEAQTRGYNAAIQLGGRSVRYVTNLVMEGVLRAPTVMAELVQTGQLAIENTRMEDVTDRPGGSGQGRQAPTDMDMSDDENTGGAGPSHKQSDSEFALNSDAEKENRAKVTKKGKAKTAAAATKRRKKSSVDLALSSGDEADDPEFKPPANTKKPAKRAGTTTASTSANSTLQRKSAKTRKAV